MLGTKPVGGYWGGKARDRITTHSASPIPPLPLPGNIQVAPECWFVGGDYSSRFQLPGARSSAIEGLLVVGL